jgi:hypothetical protein
MIYETNSKEWLRALTSSSFLRHISPTGDVEWKIVCKRAHDQLCICLAA